MFKAKLEAILNSAPWIQRHKDTFDLCYGFACIIGVPAMGVVAVTWALQGAPIYGVKLRELPTRFLSPGESTYVAPPIEFSDDTKKIAYDVWITNTAGDTVFHFPTIMIDRSRGYDPNQLIFKLPDNLPAGTYIMNAKAFYKLNPIQTANVQMELAKIVIK